MPLFIQEIRIAIKENTSCKFKKKFSPPYIYNKIDTFAFKYIQKTLAQFFFIKTCKQL